MPLSLDIVIFVVFLGINLIVGLRYGRQVKSLADYAIGEKNFSTATLTATIIATYASGGMLFYTLEHTYSTGLYFILAQVGDAIAILIVGQVLSVRMGEFLKNLSVAEAMGDLYGSTVRIITAITGVLRAIGFAAIQFTVISKVIQIIWGVEGPWVTVTAALIVMTYSSFGGIKAVTFTDVVQFFTFGAFLPILALVIWQNLHDPNQVTETLTTNPNFDIKKVVGWHPEFLSAITLMLYFVIPSLGPAQFQRIAMARNVVQVKRSFTLAAGIYFLIILFMVWIGVLLLSSNPLLEPDKLVNHIVNHYAYPGLKGLIGVGVVALAMSTADSHLNSSSVLLSNDVARVFNLPFKGSLSLARGFSWSLGFFALGLALYTHDLLQLLLLSCSFPMTTYVVPFYFAIFGFRSSPRACLIAMAAGVSTSLLWSHYLPHLGNNILPGMASNLAFLIGSHYLLGEPGGWVGIKDPAPLLLAQQARKRQWQKLSFAFKDFMRLSYLERTLPKKEYVYSLVGLYVVVSCYFGLYRASKGVVNEALAHLVVFASTAMITYPLWPPLFKKRSVMRVAWPVVMGTLLFGLSSLLILLSEFQPFQVMLWLLNMMVAVLLFPWPFALILAGVGCVWGRVVFQVLPSGSLVLQDSPNFQMLYGLLMGVLFLSILLRQKQTRGSLEERNLYLTTRQQEVENEKEYALQYQDRLAAALEGPYLKELESVFESGDYLVEQMADLTHAELKARVEALVESNQRSGLFMSGLLSHHLSDLREKYRERMDVQKVSFDELVHRVLSLVELHPFESPPPVTVESRTHHRAMYCEPDRLAKLLFHGVCSLVQAHGAEHPFRFTIDDARLVYRVSTMDPTRMVKGVKLMLSTAHPLPVPQTEPIYHVILDKEYNHGPAKPEELDPEDLHTLSAHYGYRVHEHTDENSTYTYVFPVYVRPMIGDPTLPHMSLPDRPAYWFAQRMERVSCLRMVLQERGFTLTPREQHYIESCSDLALLEQWLHNAFNSASVQEVLDLGGTPWWANRVGR